MRKMRKTHLLLFVSALLLSICVALLSPWPEFAIAPALFAPFSVLLIFGLAVISLLAPEGPMRRSTQNTMVLVTGFFMGSLAMLLIVKAV